MTDAAITEAARALAARRSTGAIECEVCGAERIVVVRTGVKRPRTCGRSCRDKLLYRERKTAKPKP